MGIPIARWADVGNRRNIIGMALVVWRSLTMLSGLAQSYTQLLLVCIGVGVGVGKAGASPPSHSIMSDYHGAEERGVAISIYSSGVYFGTLFGLLFGGWLYKVFGWRMAFFWLGYQGY